MTDVSDTVHVDALLGSLERVGKTVEAIAAAATKPAAPPSLSPPVPPQRAGGPYP